jgi:hypothetical protein
VGGVVFRLSVTVICAEACAERALSEDGGSCKSVVALLVEGSIDGSIAVVDWVVESWRSNDRVVGVTVGASNQNLERASPLTSIDGIGLVDLGTPENALDHGHWSWVCASGTWFKAGVALEVQIERQTTIDSVALLGASVDVVTLKSAEA